MSYCGTISGYDANGWPCLIPNLLQQDFFLSDDEETRYLAEMRERALMAERIEIEAALARGKVEGKEEGVAEGKAESLRLLIESGIPEAQARTILRM